MFHPERTIPEGLLRIYVIDGRDARIKRGAFVIY